MDTGIEYLDLVDENDAVIGNMSREEIYAKKLKNYRTVHLFIKNSVWKLWIPKRTQEKSWPGSLDCSMAGHVMSGESYDEAMIRETQEELNIGISMEDVKLLGYINPFQEGSIHFPCFSAVYEYCTDTEPNYNRDDFSEAYWLTPQELLEKLDDPTEPLTKDIIVKIVNFYYR